MIDHSDCDHDRTSSARAKCRRLRSGGRGGQGPGGPWPSPPLYSLGPPPKVKEVKWGGKSHHDPDRERNTGQVPGRRDLECHVCHVERIVCSGTDISTGMLLFVGERCAWRIESSEDFKVVQA